MKKIAEPSHLEYAMYYEQYLKRVDKNISVLDQLKNNCKTISETLKSLDEHTLTNPYQLGKWSIKDIIIHLMDCERVFMYRAMRFSRNDKTPLPFFDENEYAAQANANQVSTKKLLAEYVALRKSTLLFFNNLNAAQLKRVGMASNYNMSVRACAWIICAHELHHWHVIQERYLKTAN